MAKVFRSGAASLTTSLAEYWKGDSLTGFYASNVLTNNNSVTIGATGGPTSGSGKAFDLGSTNLTKYLSIGSALGFTGNGAFTFACWIKTAGVMEADGRLLYMNTPAANDILITIIETSLNPGNIRFRRTADVVDDPIEVVDAALHFVCIRWTANTLTGNVDARTAVTVASSTTSGEGAGEQTSIGAHSAGIQHWTGQISECGFWTKKLADSEVTDLYNAGAGNTMIESSPTGGLLMASLALR